MRPLTIVGGRVLVADSGLTETGIALQSGHIATIGETGDGHRLDATGLLVLPGIVDLHGDAFERQLQPRPGVDFPPDIALIDTEAQLLANGITTAFHGVTLSWEPGLRSLDMWQSLRDALHARRWTCDMRIHLRWEAYNLDALDTAVSDIAAGRVGLVAFNDHTPTILRRLQDPVSGAKYSDRAGMTLPAFRDLAARIGERASEIPPAMARIAEAAHTAGVPLASHDDDTAAARATFREFGARICEFPMAAEVGQAARAAGDWVAMGSPNVVRGRSHLGWASAAQMAEEGICTVLTSDYFYPAMPRAALILAGRGVLDLTAAWALISANPAAAAGLSDRGRIAVGARADLVLIHPETMRVVTTICAGQIAYLTTEAAARLG